MLRGSLSGQHEQLFSGGATMTSLQNESQQYFLVPSFQRWQAKAGRLCGDGAQVARRGFWVVLGRVRGRKWSRNAAGRDFDSGRWGDQLATSWGWIGTSRSHLGLTPSNCDLFLRPCIPRYIIYKCAYFSRPNNFTYNHAIWE